MSAAQVELQKFFRYLALGWSLLVLLLIAYTDIALSRNTQQSDYLMTFHTAGRLADLGRAGDRIGGIIERPQMAKPQELYPPAGALTFTGTDFDKAAHEFLPYLPKSSTAEYMYMPIVALLFAPLGSLDPSFSLITFQLLCFAALFAGQQVLTRAIDASGESTDGSIPIIMYWLTLIPLAITVWIGQVGIVFGLLPLCAGLAYQFRGHAVKAGLIYSIAALKPQFLIAPLLVAAALALGKKPGCLAGIALGLSALVALNLVAFPVDMLSQWLTCLKFSDTVYSNLSSGVNQAMATSLPRAIILMLPPQEQQTFKLVIYAGSAAIALFALFQIFRLLRSRANSVQTLALAMLIALAVIPLIAPHVFFYDYTFFALSAPLAYCIKWPEKIAFTVRSSVLLNWIIIDIYGLIVMTNKALASPFLPLAVVAILLLRLSKASQQLIASEV